MKALLIERPHAARLVVLPTPEPGDDEVLVRVAAVGLCGSDLELLEGRRPLPYVRYPIVPGHEWAGTIERVGSRVRSLAPGDKVTAEGFRACGTCRRCRAGDTNLCEDEYAETGFTHQGACAEYVAVPARLVRRLADDASLEAAALLEPAACVANGLLAADLRPGMTAAVVGAGTLGLLAVSLLRLSSPSRLVLVGTRPERCVLGERLGADESWDSSNHGGEGEFDLVVEATNHPSGAADALRLARRGGTVILEGISGARTPVLDPDLISLGQLRVQGIFGASGAAWEWVVGIFARGLLDPTPLITHRFPLDRFDDAFTVMRDRQSGAIKVQVGV